MLEFSNVSQFAGVFDQNAKKHLLSRALLGYSIKDINDLENLNLNQALDLLLADQVIPSPPLNHYESQVVDTTGIKLGETWVKAAYGDGTINSRRRTSLRAWWIQKMIAQKTNFTEKLVLFWHNHFATELPDYDDSRFGFEYQNKLRQHAMGNFKEMVKSITLDPAMLLYLNGHRNTKAAPDENYARELQELFTLGKGPNSKYTEEDVKAAAKVLTGFRADRDKIGYLFNGANHDTSDKQFSSFYANTIIKGKTGADGEKELDDLLNMIFNVNEVSKYIVRRFYVFYFYYDITPKIETSFIEPMAEVFRKNNFQIKPLLRAMFSSDHFFDESLRGAMIKSPLDHIVGTAKIFPLVWPDVNGFLLENYGLAHDLAGESDKAQQVLTAPPSVAGWPAYYQEPVFHEIWINSTTMMQRVRFTDTLINKGFKRTNSTLTIDPLSLIKKLKKPEDPVSLINELEFLLLHISIKTELKTQLKKDILLAGQASDYYWTELWAEYLKSPNATNTSMVTSRILKLITYFCALPEYQLS